MSMNNPAKRAKVINPRKPMIQQVEPWLYLLPFLLGVLCFTLYPVINVVLASFKEGYRYPALVATDIGLGNYTEVINDKFFRQALSNTAIYVITVVPIATALSVIIAYLLNQKIRGNAIFQTAYFLPMVTCSTAVGLSWRLMFNTKFGIINYVLGCIVNGIANFTQSVFGVNIMEAWFGITEFTNIAWLDKIPGNMPALIIYGIWAILPFTIILLLSGLQNIDEMYYTAAKVDGAKSLRIFFRITVPLLLPTIGMCLIVNMISAFKVFNELFPLFKGKPGMAYNLYTVVYYIYDQFYGSTKNFGTASAAAIILFSIIFVFTMIQLRMQRKWKHY